MNGFHIDSQIEIKFWDHCENWFYAKHTTFPKQEHILDMLKAAVKDDEHKKL